jgi:hypothetical protein
MWESVIVKAARKPVVSKRLVMRDWILESITLRRGLTTCSTTCFPAAERSPRRGAPGVSNSHCRSRSDAAAGPISVQQGPADGARS